MPHTSPGPADVLLALPAMLLESHPAFVLLSGYADWDGQSNSAPTTPRGRTAAWIPSGSLAPG